MEALVDVPTARARSILQLVALCALGIYCAGVVIALALLWVGGIFRPDAEGYDRRPLSDRLADTVAGLLCLAILVVALIEVAR